MPFRPLLPPTLLLRLHLPPTAGPQYRQLFPALLSPCSDRTPPAVPFRPRLPSTHSEHRSERIFLRRPLRPDCFRALFRSRLPPTVACRNPARTSLSVRSGHGSAPCFDCVFHRPRDHSAVCSFRPSCPHAPTEYLLPYRSDRPQTLRTATARRGPLNRTKQFRQLPLMRNRREAPDRSPRSGTPAEQFSTPPALRYIAPLL